MDAFNLIKEVSELLYYWVGIAGLVTIYIAIKNNRQVKIEREELRKEKELLKQQQLDKEKREKDEVLRNFKFEIYPDFKKNIGCSTNFIPPGFQLIDYFASKDIPKDMKEKLKDSISDKGKNDMKKYIDEMEKVVETITEKDIELSEMINEMFQYCIYECVELKVHINYLKLFNFVYAYNKEKMNNASV